MTLSRYIVRNTKERYHFFETCSKSYQGRTVMKLYLISILKLVERFSSARYQGKQSLFLFP